MYLILLMFNACNDAHNTYEHNFNVLNNRIIMPARVAEMFVVLVVHMNTKR